MTAAIITLAVALLIHARETHAKRKEAREDKAEVLAAIAAVRLDVAAAGNKGARWVS